MTMLVNSAYENAIPFRTMAVESFIKECEAIGQYEKGYIGQYEKGYTVPSTHTSFQTLIAECKEQNKLGDHQVELTRKVVFGGDKFLDLQLALV